MALSVQNDSGSVADANAYIDADWFASYHAARGFTSTADTAAIEAAIVKATDYLDVRFNFIGSRGGTDQTTEWPRYNAMDIDRRLISGVPEAVKKATAEYAKIALDQILNPTPERNDYGATVLSISESVGPIEESVRFAKSGNFELPKYPIADRYLISRGLVLRNRQIRRG